MQASTQQQKNVDGEQAMLLLLLVEVPWILHHFTLAVISPLCCCLLPMLSLLHFTFCFCDSTHVTHYQLPVTGITLRYFATFYLESLHHLPLM